jgi:long-chain acyl-CoA synthetase
MTAESTGPGTAAGTFLGAFMPVFRLPEMAARQFPDHVALDFFGRRHTYAELAREIRLHASLLRKFGAGRGTKILLMAPNCPQSVVSYYAILRAGGIVVNANPAATSSEIAHILADSGAEMAVTVNLKRLTDALADAVEKAGTASRLQTALVGDFASALPFKERAGFLLFKSALITRPYVYQGMFRKIRGVELKEENAPAASIDPYRDVAALQYTGGTTGVAKAAVLTHANLYANCLQSAERIGFLTEGEERIAAVLPFFHVFAMTAVMNVGLHRGFRLTLYPKPDLPALFRDISRGDVTVLPGVPTLFSRMLRHPLLHGCDFSRLKACISGGAPLPPSLKETFEARTGVPIVEGYGLTEASPVVALCAFGQAGGGGKGSVGTPLTGTEIRIRKYQRTEDGKATEVRRPVDMPPGETGEICVRGPQVMRGYAGGGDSGIDGDGWLHTGDLGYLDEAGRLYVAGRCKEMIIVCGFNVYPREIEELLLLRPDVAEAAVVGVPDEDAGQAVKAFVVPAVLDAPPSEEALLSFLREHLSYYKIPKSVTLLTEMPKTATGKADKKGLG